MRETKIGQGWHGVIGAALALLLQGGFAYAVVIDNDIPSGTLGHWSVDVLTGGQSRSGTVTANRLASGDTVTTDVLFDYFSYVAVGSTGGAFQLNGSLPTVDSLDPDQVISSGSFVGEAGNTIDWSVSSTIADGGAIMANVFVFAASDGTLGRIRLLQYMDEDVEGAGDDVFFTRGSLAQSDLELFTVDDNEVFGVSHSGSLSSARGLVNAGFAGWAADEYDNMRPSIQGSGQPVAPTGIIMSLPAIAHPVVGAAFGPSDIVSVLAWDVDPEAATAAVITTLGGVPDVTDIPMTDANPPVCVLTPQGTPPAFVLGTGTDDRPSEDTNGNGILDPGEDLNGNASIDEDTGVTSVALAPGTANLSLTVTPFVPGDGSVTFRVDPVNGAAPAVGTVVVTDGNDNTCLEEVRLGTFDPFGGIVRTPRRDLRLTLRRPSPDTDGVRCVEAADPEMPDFDDLPFTPFDGDEAEIDILLSEGDGEKAVCCQFRSSQGDVSPAVCETVTVDSTATTTTTTATVTTTTTITTSTTTITTSTTIATTTSTSTSTAPTTTTTTSPPGECPVAATFESIACRLEALVRRVDGMVLSEPFRANLIRGLELRALRNTDRAEAADAEGNARRAQRRLRQARRGITNFLHRLDSLVGSRKVDPAVAEALEAAALAIAADMDLLRASL